MSKDFSQVINAEYAINYLMQEIIKQETILLAEKYRDSAHWSCNINLKLTIKVPGIFHNLKGSESYSILQEIGKFDVNVSVIANGFAKNMAFASNNNLFFIDSM